MTELVADHSATIAEEEELPKTKEKLQELSQVASIHYSTKNFAAAAESYADAVGIQAELNGEMAPENAELLFHYGRALYKVGVSKSDVLGNKVAKEEKKKPQPKKAAKAGASDTSSTASGANPTQSGESVQSKPYFQLQGDENWDDSDDDVEKEQGGHGEEEDDDFAIAYEIFDMARVLYTKQLETAEPSEGGSIAKGKEKAQMSVKERLIKERIADCYGFLAEISLENETFHIAVLDARAALALQEDLHPFEHQNVTEAHYSLSLALEFASVSKVREDQTGQPSAAAASPIPKLNEEESIDWDLRKEAAKETRLAIESLEARLVKEETGVEAATLTADQKKEKKSIIQDKKGMLEDLRTRLKDLELDPTNQQFDSIDSSVREGLYGGLLGDLLGASAATQRVKIAEATKAANDVTGLVKTRKKVQPAAMTPVETSNGKRKLEAEGNLKSDKRAKTEEPVPS